MVSWQRVKPNLNDIAKVIQLQQSTTENFYLFI